MSRLVELRARLEARAAPVGVVGLGYVGLAVVTALAQAGFSVTGVDIKADRVARISAGQNPIEGDEPGLAEALAQVVAAGRLRATVDYRVLREADVILISVDTPVDDDRRPRFEALLAACSELGGVLSDGALVIVESTIAPGTIERVVAPLLEARTGRRLNQGFYLGHCPERVMPGKLLANLHGMSRVCGGSTPETAETMATLYRSIVQAELDLTDCVTAELVKTAENTYRDVNIAFANELALVCEASGGDFLRVRELVNKSPGRNVLLAGAGVGGHCIPKDPWLLAYGAQEQAPLRLVPSARQVNDAMPEHVAGLLRQGLGQHHRTLAGARVAVMGYAYLEDCDDARNSPSAALVSILQKQGAQVLIHDPYVPGYEREWQRVAQQADGIVFMVAHSAYRQLDLTCLSQLLRTPVLVDGRRVFSDEAAQQAGLSYLAVGLGRRMESLPGGSDRRGQGLPRQERALQDGQGRAVSPLRRAGQLLGKVGLLAWIGATLFLFIVLFIPPEFYTISERLGVYHVLLGLRAALLPFFAGGY
jgi:UDP-N-acetyl-D-mannosaminuronic acid dehydrogenase